MAKRSGTIPDRSYQPGAGRFLLDTLAETVLKTALFFLRFFAWGVQWSVASLIFVAVMAGAGYYVYTEALAGGQQVTIPNLVGQSIMDANMRLAEQGLEMGKQTLIPHPTVPKYHVISQQPPSGRVVRTGRRVYCTVSAGTDYMQAPSYLQMTLDAAQRQIQQTRFRIGSVSRIVHPSPRDTIIAQDPPAGQPIANEGTINLLVSGGTEKKSAFMPAIKGLTVEEARRIMAPLGVNLVADEVDLPDAQPGVVLDQHPAADAMVYEGQIVTYQVKAAANTPLAASRFQTEVRHVIPYNWFDRDVRVEMVDPAGARQVLWTKPPAYDEQSRATYIAGSAIRLPIAYSGECSIEIVVDSQRVAAYSLKDGAEPVRTAP